MSSMLQYLFDDDRDRKISVRFWWFVAGSVAFHFLTFGVATEVNRIIPTPTPEPVMQVSFREDPATTEPKVEPSESSPTVTVPAVMPRLPFASAVVEMMAPPEPKPARASDGKTIVELPVANNAVPDAADYLSQFNNRTDRQTVRQGEGGQGGSQASDANQPASAVLIPPIPGVEAKPEPTPAPEAAPPAPRSAPPSPPTPPLRRPLSPPAQTDQSTVASAVNPDGNHSPALSTNIFKPGQQPPDARPGGITRRDLMLNPADMAAIEKDQQRDANPSPAAGSDAGDHPTAARPGQLITSNLAPGRRGSIEDLRRVNQGDLTVLNSYASKYAEFFNSMKRLIFFHWVSYVGNAFKIMSDYNPEYLGPGTHDLETVIEFRIDQDGKVVRKEVQKSCGVLRADDFALQSIRLAAPFPGVPPELLDEKGELEIDFGFDIRRQ